MIRNREPEMMDDPAADAGELAIVLRVLNRTNRLLGMDRRMFAALHEFGPPEVLSLLDIGSGGGGFLEYVAQRDGKNSQPLRIGLDRSPVIARTARKWHGERMAFLVGDALAPPFRSASVDVVTCSLFLHHFDPPAVKAILREMARIAKRGIVVCDLSRSRLSLILTWLVTRITSRSRLFHVDGPRSVQAAYEPEEMREMAGAAGLENCRVSRIFPFRYLMTWKRDA